MFITIYFKDKLDMGCVESHGLIGVGKSYYPKKLIDGVDLNNNALRFKITGMGYQFLGDRVDSPIYLSIQEAHLFFRISNIKKYHVVN